MSETTTAKPELGAVLLDSLDFGLIALDAQHHVLHVNRKALEILDADASRLLGRAIGDVVLSRTPGYSLWPGKLGAIDGEPREVMLEFEGRELLLQVRWLSVQDHSGGPSIMMAFEDVTEVVGEMEFQ